MAKHYKQLRNRDNVKKHRVLLQLLQQTFAFTDGANKCINCRISLLSKLRYHSLTVSYGFGNLRTLQLLFQFFEPQIQLNAKKNKKN